MLRWINRIDLFWAFVLLCAAHILLYYSLGTENWLLVAALAALVDTGILGVIQYAARAQKQKQ